MNQELNTHGYDVLLNDPYMEESEMKILHEYRSYKFSFVESIL